MHAQGIALLGQDEIQCGEHPFFDLTRIARPANKDHLPAEIQNGKVALPQAIVFGIRGLKAGCVQDHPLRLKILQFFIGGDDEHIVHKVTGPWQFGDHPDGNPMGRMRAGINVPDVEILSGEMSSDLVGQFFKGFWADLLIDIAPPYSVFGQIIRNNEAVFWGASGEFTCVHRYGALIRSGGHSFGQRDLFQFVGG